MTGAEQLPRAQNLPVFGGIDWEVVCGKTYRRVSITTAGPLTIWGFKPPNFYLVKNSDHPVVKSHLIKLTRSEKKAGRHPLEQFFERFNTLLSLAGCGKSRHHWQILR